MMTETSRKMTTPKYPGWLIERLGPDAYLMTREPGIYAISVTYSEAHGWAGELLTRQYRDGSKTWEPARTPYTHSVLGCTREADRREAWIAKQAANRKGR